MSTIEQDELRLSRPPWRILVASLRPAVVGGALVAYTSALGAHGLGLTLQLAALILGYGWITVLSTAAGVATALGPAPAVTPEGLGVRPRPWRRETVLLRWSEVTAAWIGYVGRRAYLCVRTNSPRVPVTGRPLPVYIPPDVAPETVRAAVERLSGGAVPMWNHDPDGPGGRQRVRFTERPASTARVVVPPLLFIVFWLLTIPFVLGVPQVWNQPWWP
jgi:hypothetical protein